MKNLCIYYFRVANIVVQRLVSSAAVMLRKTAGPSYSDLPSVIIQVNKETKEFIILETTEELVPRIISEDELFQVLHFGNIFFSQEKIAAISDEIIVAGREIVTMVQDNFMLMSSDEYIRVARALSPAINQTVRLSISSDLITLDFGFMSTDIAITPSLQSAIVNVIARKKKGLVAVAPFDVSRHSCTYAAISFLSAVVIEKEQKGLQSVRGALAIREELDARLIANRKPTSLNPSNCDKMFDAGNSRFTPRQSEANFENLVNIVVAGMSSQPPKSIYITPDEKDLVPCFSVVAEYEGSVKLVLLRGPTYKSMVALRNALEEKFFV